MSYIGSHSFYLMLAVLAALMFSSLFLVGLRFRNPKCDYTELALRIRSWWWMIAIVFFALALPLNWTIVFVAFLSFLALKELLSIVPIRHADRGIVFWAYLSIPIQYYWLATDWYGMFVIFIPVYMFLFFPLVAVLKGETDGFIRSTGVIHWAVMMTVYCISHMGYLMMLPSKNADAGPLGMVLFLLVLTQLNDVSQYVWGKSFGKHKIVPKVSPNKTWEGFFGGTVTISVVSYFVAPLMTPLNQVEGLMAGLIIGLSGFVGDLVISSVKRDLRIKDTGTMIPGHGGILDRIDSLMFTAPLFFHFVRYLHY